LPIVVSVLIVTCPCALALATPMALAVATSSAAKRGLLVTRSHALETLARATHFVIDKTGTLTLGKPSVHAVYPLNADREEALSFAAALEQGSEHPVATAMREAARNALHAEQVRNVPGCGVEGVVAGRKLRIGTESFAGQLAVNADTREIEAQIWLADEEGMLAGFDLQDQLRPDAAAFVAALRAQGAQISLLSGDRQSVVRDTAIELGIETWRATMSPEQKLEYVKALQAQGAVVAMVRQNLAWAIAYNALAIPLAMTGYITPWMAAIGMSASSLLVVGNATRLAGERRAHRMVLVND
jgi:Cu2+-exporting ATPase